MALLDELKRLFALKGETLNNYEIVDLVAKLSNKPIPLKIADPEPVNDGIYLPLEDGVYVNADGLKKDTSSGGDDEGMQVQFIKNGSEWAKNKILLKVDITGVVEKDNEFAVKGGEVWSKTLPKSTDKALPESFSFLNYDRRDVSNSLILLDKDNKVISQQNSAGDQSYGTYFPQNIDESFPISSEWYNWESIYNLYDQLMNDYNGLDKYISKTEIGRSSSRNIPINMYSFKPRVVKDKILLVCGTHGSERTYQRVLYRFLETLCNQWMTDAALRDIKDNVQIDVIPMLSPTACLGNGWDGSSRRTPETVPFPVTWQKQGNSLTISFETADFPTSNPNVSANTYFSNSDIVNKICVSLFDSDNSQLVPANGYVVKEIINGRSVVCETAVSGNGNGIAQMYITVDLNRNGSLGNGFWENYTSISNIEKYPGDLAPSSHSNKGTNPNSLSEIVAYQNLIANNDYKYMIDIHSGSGENYLDWGEISSNGSSLANKIKAEQSFLSPFEFRKFQGYPELVSNTLAGLFYTMKSRNGYTIEWSQPNNLSIPPNTITPLHFNNAHRWMAIIISNLLNLKY